MSGQPTTPTAPPPSTAAPPRNEIIIYSHSNLFYWWPVWALGLLMAVLTIAEGSYMVVVPPPVKDPGTGKREEGIKRDIQVTVTDAQTKKEVAQKREGYVLPPGEKAPEALKVHMTSRSGLGVIFCTVLLLVIVITNVPLRGMWSILVIISLVTLSLVFHLLGWWDDIIRRLSLLDIRINLGGYLFLSLVLLGIWLFTLFFFDRQIYMVFTPGQLKVCTEIGGGEKVYDAMGMQIEKQRSDIFRHWVLGLGSGDLIVKTSGAQAHHFDLPNVLFIGKKVAMIEEMLKKRTVVETR